MTISLYDISVASYLQTLEGVQGYLEKGLVHCQETGADPQEIVETCLAPDMRPFRFQVQHTVFHSLGAVRALESGSLTFQGARPEHDFAGLQALVAEAREALGKIDPAALNARAGGEVVLKAGESERLFSAEGFVLSFSLPNFHFHAATAYAILRSKGAPIGKRDFMGPLRLKGG